MYKSNKIRTWINKNDGEYFQVENHTFNAYEASGYILIILALVVYLFHDKAGFDLTWIGWLVLCFGCIALFIGVMKKVRNAEKT